MYRQKTLVLSFFLILLTACGILSPFVQFARAQYLSPEKTLTQFVHNVWGTEEGLPQGSVNAIAQTDDGYLWFGTQEGLVRFDGEEMHVYDKRSVAEFESNDIRILHVDRQGTLWIGTRDAGLMRYKGGRFAVPVRQDSLRDARISAIAEGQNEDHLWIGTSGSGLKKLARGKISSVPGVETGHITALYETPDGVLWIGTHDAGLIRYAHGETQTFTVEEGLPDNNITALSSSRHGGIWIGTKGGLVHYHAGSFFTITVEHGLSADNITSLFEDKIGSLWIGTNQEGVDRLVLDLPAMESQIDAQAITTKPELVLAMHASFHDHMQIDIFATQHGLSYHTVKSLFQDEEGNMWLGTDGGGVNMLREGKFTTYTSHEGVADDFILAIHEADDGSMWFSTEKGVSRLKDGNITSLTAADGLGADYVISVESTPDGSLWFGTFGGGLSQLKNGVLKTYTTEDGLPNNAIFGLYTAKNGDLWIATGRGAAVYDGNTFVPYTKAEGLSSDYVTVMLERANGDMWIATYDNGINRVVDGRIEPLKTKDGLSHNEVLSLHEDEDGVMWIGTYGGGLNRVDGESVTVYSTKEGLFNDNIQEILEDDNGNLWMSCNLGLFRVNKAELKAFAEGKADRITSHAYDTSDGLKTREFNGGVQPAGWKSQDGQLWFPSSKGVAMIDPDHILQNPFPPRMIMEQVLIDGEEASLAGNLELSPGKNKVEFHYVGLSYISPENVHYQYKLEGVDEDWVDAGSRRAAYYTNLEPGPYTFYVKAFNNDGLESKAAITYGFYLRPFFYQTIWFYICLFITIVLGFIGIYRWRVAKIKAHEKKLEHLVDQRTRNLEERTADLMQALEENKEILGITSHDLKNPLGGIIGLADILIEDLNLLTSDPTVDDGIENVRLMKTEAERMLRIVTDLLDRHNREELVNHGRETINLVDLVKDSIRRNKPAAESKEIAIHFENQNVLLVEADEDAMLRVADNLISNAVKYSPSNRNIWITLTPDGDEVCMRVKDEGPGLTEEDKHHVFGKLQRLSARPTAGEHSSGLGLFIVKQLIEEVEGAVGVESEFGNGACFWVRLPLQNAFAAV
ncbi:MAG: two-component regulator propeller domain-containing protein [Bacteroidota bacterium]